ncbi:VOC family protein [Maribacter sp. 2308TA10-17]|uniref:VOC family protein n=1 Tax=Maribacter sp. 2308TA10-17 TaxID=3386276 RepID=UPI0039BC4A63
MNSISLEFLKFIIIDRKVDHIVYVVSDLREAIQKFKQKLGVQPVFGGYHKNFGTKNALINLNNQTYLELLAADNLNTAVTSPRWMGIDLLSKNQITRWAIKSDTLEKDSIVLKTYNSEMGEIKEGSRNTADGSLLKWKLIMPLPKPEVEIIPFFLDWSNTQKHPSQILPNMGCELVELCATHPNPLLFEGILKNLDVSIKIGLSEEVSIKGIIKCPKGFVEI